MASHPIDRPDTNPPAQLTHLDEGGNVHMVDVTERSETLREAVAKARVRVAPQTARLIAANQISKGSVLEVAKIAGIMAAKQTPQMIPLCHPLPMTHIDPQFCPPQRCVQHAMFVDRSDATDSTRISTDPTYWLDQRAEWHTDGEVLPAQLLVKIL